MAKPGSSKSKPWKPSRYRKISPSKFGCVIKVDDRFEAHYPLNTKKRAAAAAVRYETFKNKPSKQGITTECVQAGLRKNICKAYRKHGMTDNEWYDKRCK